MALAAVGTMACSDGAKDAAASADTPAAVAAATSIAPASTEPAHTSDSDTSWVVLFDGTNLDQWRGYKKTGVPGSWKIEGKALAFEASPNTPDRGDLITREQFGDFEFEYEWKVAPGANGGVMWRVSEDEAVPWMTGPEQQVLDDDRHADGKFPTHRAGALYDLVEPPKGIARPVGEFNQGRIVARGSHVQLFLNGQKTADVDFASDAGRKLVAASKFKTMPRFAQNASGHIVLQDHGDRVWFRNMRVRRLTGAA